MDKQATDAPSTRQFVAAEPAKEADCTRPTAAAPAQKADGTSRLREFTVSDDGQMVEAGYGHGV